MKVAGCSSEVLVSRSCKMCEDSVRSFRFGMKTLGRYVMNSCQPMF
jgi:hypothetical protein